MRFDSIRGCRLMLTILAAGLALGGCKSGGGTGGSGDGKPMAKVNPAAVQALAKAPTPPPNAKKGTMIGSGKAMVNTSDGPGDTDSYWVQEIDVDGDGDVEHATLLWDDESKVLYASADTEVPCDMGGTAYASLLIGVNAAGNARGMAPGSGFYAIYLDASECAAQAAGLYGCKFDANGNVTAAGAAVIDEATDTITLVAYSDGN